MNSKLIRNNGLNDDDNLVDNDTVFLSEEDYEREMVEVVEPFLNKIKISGTFSGVNNDVIYYEGYQVENAKGIIVISHGYCESIIKYHEWIYYLTKNQYSVFGVDHRGHGRSVRHIDDIDGVTVSAFSHYVEDFRIFLDDIVSKNKEETTPLYLFAHSMGGCIGALFLEMYPFYFKAAILNAPMLQINTGAFPEGISKTVSNIFNKIGIEKKYIFGQPTFKEKPDFLSAGTSSKERFDYYHKLRLQDKNLQTSRGTFEWLHQAFEALNRVRKQEHASKIKIPILLFQAENDIFVRSQGQSEFASYIPQCELIPIPQSHHEIYFEKNEVLIPYFNRVLQFYNEN